MDMMSLRRRIMGAEKTLLPRAYQQVEYIYSSTKKEWIDTLATLKGDNVMWSDANGDLTVKYWTR